jgi:predicted MPP superfamily phosphohydrolase
VLDNAAVPLRPPGQPDRQDHADPQELLLYVLGVGAHFAQADQPLGALAQVLPGASRLVSMHNPQSFAAFPAGTTPFAMAEYTHGGQVRVPWTPEWTWLTYIKGETVHADGWIDGYGQSGNRLYVNRGIGFSLLPIRLNCPPEVTLFILRWTASHK